MRSLLAVTALLIPSPALAQSYQTEVRYDPVRGVDVTRYVPVNVDQAGTNRPFDTARPRETESQNRQFAAARAYGACVVASDRAGSATYIRAALTLGERSAFAAIAKTASECRKSVGRMAWQLRLSDVRLSAVADALRDR